jgi:hypothetical protein
VKLAALLQEEAHMTLQLAGPHPFPSNPQKSARAYPQAPPALADDHALPEPAEMPADWQLNIHREPDQRLPGLEVAVQEQVMMLQMAFLVPVQARLLGQRL